MTTLTTPQPGALSVPPAIQQAILKGDLSGLTGDQRLQYLDSVCQSLGLNPITRPFDFLTDKKTGKVTLYARRECAEQLGRIHGVTVEIVHQEVGDGMYVVHVRASMATEGGRRCNEDIGVVPVADLAGEALANAFKRAVTQARRRAVLGLVGLGMVDESEVVDVSPASHAAPALAVAHPASAQPAAPLPAPDRLAGLVAAIRTEYVAAKLTPQQWQQFTARHPWNGRNPTQLTASEAEQMLADFRSWLRPAVGPDGLAINQEGGPQSAATFPGTGSTSAA